MELSEIRRQVRGAIEDAKRRTAERRNRVAEATREYEQFLAGIAVPMFHGLAQALVGEGHRFKVNTPGQAVRLVPERSTEDHIEVALDSERDVPAVVVRAVRGRGRRMLSTERLLAERKRIGEISEQELLALVVEELVPFVER
jgi:hypothetical protein